MRDLYYKELKYIVVESFNVSDLEIRLLKAEDGTDWAVTASNNMGTGYCEKLARVTYRRIINYHIKFNLRK